MVSIVIVIVIVISKLLKRHSKGKHRASAYSGALPQIRGVVPEVNIEPPTKHAIIISCDVTNRLLHEHVLMKCSEKKFPQLLAALSLAFPSQIENCRW